MKRACFFAAIVSAVVLIAGCRPQKPDEETGAGRNRRILLTVLAGQSTSDPGIEEMISEVVERELPDVELFWEQMDWGEQFQEQMKNRFAAGEIPDIMIGKAQDVSGYAMTGNLAPFSEQMTSLIRRDALQAVTRDGVTFGIPFNAFYQGILYNQEIFERYRLPVPATREELRRNVEILEKNDITPFAAHFEETWYTANIFMQLAIGEVFGENVDWGDRFRAGDESFRTSPAMIDCLRSIEYVLEHSWTEVLTFDQTTSDERFARGQAAMYPTGSWSLQTIALVNPDLNLGIFPYPNRNGDAKLIREPNLTFMKSAVTSHPDAVDQVLRVIVSDHDLAFRIFDYTKTASLLKGVEPEHPLPIQPDIDEYLGSESVIDANRGNAQLIWGYQESLAEKIVAWLRGEADIDEVLEYADANRTLSAP